jgi:hypothetical protein
MKINTARESVSQHGYDRQEGGFKSASVVLPAINEVRSLYQTVDTIFEYSGESILEVIIIVCHKTTAAALFACNELREKYAGRIRVIPQKLPFLGGALREGLLAAGGSHAIVMFSDGESDPRSVGALISEARRNPEAIISASRWLKRNSFEGYPAVKTVFNYLFQKVFSLLYWEKITDFTFGYRIYPAPLIQAIEWEETRHPFVLESILKPLRLSVDVLEIPSAWKARSEGESQMKLYMYFRYLWIGLKVRITQRKRFLK